MNAVEQFANYLKSEFNRFEKIDLPISKIDGLPVEVYIQHKNVALTSYWYLRVITDSDECLDVWDCDEDESSVMCFDKSIKKPDGMSNDEAILKLVAPQVLEVLNTYKFCKLNSSFMSPTELENRVHLVSIFKNIFTSNVTLAYDECCVCLEDTRKKTQCGHTLCVVCHSSIKKIKVADSEYKMKCCPMCTEQMHI